MSLPSIFQAAVTAKLFGKKRTGKVYSDGENLYFFPYSSDYSLWPLLLSSVTAFAIAYMLYWSTGLEVGNGMQEFQVTSIMLGLGVVGYPLLLGLLVAMGLNLRGYLKQRAVIKELGEEELYLGADLSERAELDTSCIVVPLDKSDVQSDAKGLSVVTADGDRIRMEPLQRDPEFGAKLAQTRRQKH